MKAAGMALGIFCASISTGISACGSKTTATSVSRALASDPEQLELETEFQSLIRSGDPFPGTRSRIDQMVEAYYRAERQARLFDEQPDPAGSENYPRLLALWQITQELERNISYIYGRLSETEAGSREARLTLRRLRDYLDSRDGADRVALSSFLREKEPAESPADPAVAAEIENRVAWAASTRTEMADRVDELAMEISVNLGRPHGDTGHPRFYPDFGAQGTISGNEFPEGTWALTFDDGPLPRYSSQILENLRTYNIRATFFELAERAVQYPETSLDIRAAGMATENHSYTHPVLPKLGDARLAHEVDDSTRTLTEIWGARPRFFRLPYGAGLGNQRVREAIAREGMIHVFWNVDSLDWHDKNPASIVARVERQMAARKRGIILFHDTHPQSVQASRMLMSSPWASSLRWVTIPEIVDELNY